MEEIDKKKENWRNILDDKKKEFSKKVKLLPSKTHYFKVIKKFKIFEDLIDNKTNLLILRTYCAYDSELDLIKSKENPTTFDKFVIEESGGNKNLIRYYHKIPTIDELPKNPEWSTYNDTKFTYIIEVLFIIIKDTYNCYWPNIYLDCEEFVNKCINYMMYKIHKKKRVVKYIRTKRPGERYQVDLVEISAELKMKINFYTCLHALIISLNMLGLFQ